MKVLTKNLHLETKGAGDLIDITDFCARALKESKLKEGNLSVFVVGSTAAITSFEYEPGLIKDMKDLYEKIAPSDRHYAHDETWGDANGFSHIRAALQGPSLTIPFTNSKLKLGTWQQVVLAEFDNRPRKREVVVQLIGE
jgi:secondary thiamine-phosphate synthase enzyme